MSPFSSLIKEKSRPYFDLNFLCFSILSFDTPNILNPKSSIVFFWELKAIASFVQPGVSSFG